MDDVESRLRETLAVIQTERDKLRERLQTLDRQERGIKQLLGLPESDHDELESEDSPVLGHFIRGELEFDKGLTSSEIRQKADHEGIPYRDGRSINAVLQGLRNSGFAEQLPDGSWIRSPTNSVKIEKLRRPRKVRAEEIEQG